VKIDVHEHPFSFISDSKAENENKLDISIFSSFRMKNGNSCV